MTEQEAVAETQRIASQLNAAPPPFGGGQGEALIYKKTDSALRGHVVPELSALLAATPYRRAVYVPANPSKGRTIRARIYYIGNTPIAETDFSFDPEFPATTSNLDERFPDAQAKNIIMPDAESLDDIREIVAKYNDGETLFAGAADLFSVLVSLPPAPSEGRGVSTDVSMQTPLPSEGAGGRPLILCGSTQSKPPTDLGIPILEMPLEVYDGQQTAADWFARLPLPLEDSGGLLSIPYTHRTGKATAIHLRTVMAQMARLLVSAHCPSELIIEGGATAFATLQALGWHTFTITQQLAPGIVRMQADNGTFVTLKPGSYPWGDTLKSLLSAGRSEMA